MSALAIAVSLLCAPSRSSSGQANPGRVTIRDDRKLLVGGKPFFPIGLYYSEDEQSDPTGKRLAELRTLGFNTVFFSGGLDGKPVLDRIAAAGLKVQYRPPGSLNSNLDGLKSLVPALRNHPALLFWEMEDEPILNKVSLDATREGVKLLKQLDPDHPVLCVQFPDWKKPDELKQWGAVADVYSFDTYPVPLHRWWYQGNDLPAGVPHSIAVMGHQVSWLQGLAPGKPILPVLQAWAWKPTQDGKDGYASYQQSRFMAYQVVIRGACGILYYGKRSVSAPHTPSGIPEKLSDDPAQRAKDFERAKELNAWFWSYFEVVVQELAEMAPVFTARDMDRPPTVTLAPSEKRGPQPSDIESRCKLVNGQPVVLVVNSSDYPCTIKVSGSPFAKKTVHCWHETGTLHADDTGVFTDRLEPYAVRVYATEAKLQ